MKHLQKLLLSVLVYALVVTPVGASASGEADATAELNSIATNYTTFIQGYIDTYTDNPVVISALTQLLMQLSAIQATIGGNSSVNTGLDSRGTMPGSESVVTSPSVTRNVYVLWPELWFGEESTITSISVYTSYDGNARVEWLSDDDERLVSRISYYSDDDGTGYETGYDYYKDGELESSTFDDSSSYFDLVAYGNDLLADTAEEGRGADLIDFLIRNPRVYEHSDFSSPGPVRDCHLTSEKNMMDDIIEAALIKEEKDFTTPVDSITHYFTPNMRTYDSYSAGCTSRGGSYTPTPDR